MIDLHVHSTFSDGSLTPTEVLERAALRGVKAISITDHDTCAGCSEAARAGERLGVEVLAGVEFSVALEGVGIHLLGYGTQGWSPSIERVFARLEAARNTRLVKMVSRLNELGAPISSDQVRKEAGGDIVGRLHIARLMVKRRMVPSLQVAFSQYLGRGGLAYVDRERLTPEEAFETIREMGGVAVMAHPGVMERENPGVFERAFDRLLSLGLDGIEAYYSRHSSEQTERYARLARQRGLLITGGSDFHAPNPDGLELGHGFGGLPLGMECFWALKAAISSPKTRKG
ncbi:PHP domain-containing protein [bacterium]|nr:MAG: PHP domain-containing protein [bacterium]